MKNKTFFKLLVSIYIIFALSSSAQAFYKKKVLVGIIQNPVEWDKTYNPGKIIAEFLRKELLRQKKVQIISMLETSQKMMGKINPPFDSNYVEPAIYDSRNNDFPELEFAQSPDLPMVIPQEEMVMTEKTEDSLWPSKLGKKSLKSNYIEIRGKIIQFITDKDDERTSALGSPKSRHWENAEIQIYIELVQNRTGKTLYDKTFTIISRSGTRPFKIEDLSITNMNNNSSSLGLAFNSFKNSLERFIHDKLDFLPLEGEIIATNIKEGSNNGGKDLAQEEILVNIGLINGVRVGDMFKVNKVSMKFNDLYTRRKLGDVYMKIGVIQIQEVWEGLAKAVPRAGKNFEAGFLVRSMPRLKKGDL